MGFRLLADATVVLHLAFVVFVLVGGLLVLRWRRVAWAHLPAAAWAAWIEFADWVCPLTPLENWLRGRGGQAAYTSDFIDYYVLPVLYPSALTRELQWPLGSVVLILNAAVYLAVYRRRSGR